MRSLFSLALLSAGTGLALLASPGAAQAASNQSAQYQHVASCFQLLLTNPARHTRLCGPFDNDPYWYVGEHSVGFSYSTEEEVPVVSADDHHRHHGHGGRHHHDGDHHHDNDHHHHDGDRHHHEHGEHHHWNGEHHKDHKPWHQGRYDHDHWKPKHKGHEWNHGKHNDGHHWKPSKHRGGKPHWGWDKKPVHHWQPPKWHKVVHHQQWQHPKPHKYGKHNGFKFPKFGRGFPNFF